MVCQFCTDNEIWDGFGLQGYTKWDVWVCKIVWDVCWYMV